VTDDVHRSWEWFVVFVGNVYACKATTTPASRE